MRHCWCAAMAARGSGSRAFYSHEVCEIIAGIGEDPTRVSLYALRHSNIVRMLLKNTPIRIAAALHNTSVSQVEKNYSVHISEYSDEIARAALLHEPPIADANVVPLVR